MTRPAGRSRAVTTAVMPGAAAASPTSMARIRPRATGERTIRAQHWPGALMSSPNRPRPRSRRGSSWRASLAPITVIAAAGRVRWTERPR